MANVLKIITKKDQIVSRFDRDILLLESHKCPPGFIAFYHRGEVIYLNKDLIESMTLSVPVMQHD